ncbi:MAG: SpoIIE family protein phosphatase [Acidobacteriota bacterium]|nr:SpoIIE family protein phosphatase [Acidobacteriota bacterium]
MSADSAAAAAVGAANESGLWQRILRVLSLAVAGGFVVLVTLLMRFSGYGGLATAAAAAAMIVALGLVWVGLRVLRQLLWRVGRRLAFTYFLIGVLPIPMAAFLIAVAAYLVAGLFLGHLFREATNLVYSEVATVVETRLYDPDPKSLAEIPQATAVAIAVYEDGRRVAGDERAPELWPAWLEVAGIEAESEIGRRDRQPPLVVLPDHSVSLAVARSRDGLGIVGFFDNHLETRLRGVSQVWVKLLRGEETAGWGVMDVTILGERFVLQPLVREEAAEDLRQFLNRGGGGSAFWIHGFDDAGPTAYLGSGESFSATTPVGLIGTPYLVFEQLLSSSREVDTLAWLTFVIPAFLLFDIFAVAWIMAIFMIFGLSRAVNRLSRATNAVQHGDFAHRIPVRRTDQLGVLHSSFNDMAAGLEDLIATRAQNESLEKELEIARELQESLIPSEVVHGEDVEFATHFEPSAAIGGDYFDILRLDHRRMAIVIADVSGHGLSAGLRMAMLKAALSILVEEEHDPEVILRRLDRLVRSSDEGPSFVTATLSLFDLERGRLDLVNAGHPPTYVLHGGDVREIVLPGSPLGALGDHYGSTSLDLEPGDSVVWLSDGFIEALNLEGELFGYERTVESIAGDGESASTVRDRLLDAVKTYTSGRPADDDRTMVVMKFTRKAALSPAGTAAG